jgi:hypothetical protein
VNTKYAAALAADNVLKDPEQVAKQITIRQLIAEQLIQHWRTSPRQQQGP